MTAVRPRSGPPAATLPATLAAGTPPRPARAPSNTTITQVLEGEDGRGLADQPTWHYDTDLGCITAKEIALEMITTCGSSPFHPRRTGSARAAASPIQVKWLDVDANAGTNYLDLAKKKVGRTRPSTDALCCRYDGGCRGGRGASRPQRCRPQRPQQQSGAVSAGKGPGTNGSAGATESNMHARATVLRIHGCELCLSLQGSLHSYQCESY